MVGRLLGMLTFLRQFRENLLLDKDKLPKHMKVNGMLQQK